MGEEEELKLKALCRLPLIEQTHDQELLSTTKDK